ncbi:MAG TPA: ABC transporter ATP-binding protein [Vicinamibacteria bacterium]|nr:ABC transporter ATP-binding protein [Vicinamibacteria bacterium]
MTTAEPLADATLGTEGLSVDYGRGRILDQVSFAVPKGGVFALLGRNGSGKTSLVRCLLGQQKPRGGRALLFGKDAWHARRQAMDRVGVLPEDPDAPSGMTARQLSAFCQRIYTRWDAAAVQGRLSRFEVPFDTPFGRLSRGEKGAVMLCLCLGHSPEVLVLDDPTLGLDAVVRRALFGELIAELADRGTTVFVTSHDLAGLEGLADRVAMLHHGRLVVDEPMDALKARFRRLHAPASALASWGSFSVMASRSHPWGQEAVVSNFDEARLRGWLDGHPDHAVDEDGLSLEEIFLAVCETKEGNP